MTHGGISISRSRFRGLHCSKASTQYSYFSTLEGCIVFESDEEQNFLSRILLSYGENSGEKLMGERAFFLLRKFRQLDHWFEHFVR